MTDTQVIEMRAEIAKCGATEGPYVCNRGTGHPGEHCQQGWLYDGSYDNHWWGGE